MQPQPRLWRCLTTEWVHLTHDQRRSLWFALSTARWSLAVAWRTAFLTLARRDGWLAAEEVEQFFTQVASPPVLLGLIAVLMQEGCLLAREGRQLEEVLLHQMTAAGAWRHPGPPARSRGI